MAELFGCTTRNVRLHLENIYACGELEAETTRKDIFLVRQEGSRRVSRCVTCYDLDAIISVGYRVNSIKGVQFRRWATNVLRDYLLKGFSVNARMNQLEDKMDRRLAKQDADIVDLKEKGVSVELVTTHKGNRLATSDIATFNAQYGGLMVRTTKNFHDRYLIIDDKCVYLFGASLKDLGWKCFCAMKVEGAEVAELKARI